MNEYKLLLDEGVLVARFFDDYVADEADQLMLRIVQSLTMDEIYSLKLLIWDLKDVTSMTLQNTDLARVGHFEQKIVKSLVGFKQPSNTSGRSTEDVIAFVNNLKFVCVGPGDSAVRDIFAERLDRIRVKSRKMQTLTMGDEKNVHELLQSLGLERLKPRLEGKWQVI
jgi:hypothetical protein